MRPRGPLLALWLALAIALVAARPPQAAAEETEASDEEQPKIDLQVLEAQRRGVALLNPLRPRVSRYMNAAQEEFQKENAEEAERLLNHILESRLNRLEQAFVYRLLGYVAYGSEEPERAIEYFRKALEQEALPVKDEATIRFNIAQLYAQLERWDEVIHAIDEWLPYVREPDPLGFFLKAIAYYQVKQIDPAITYIRKALAIAPAPREPWLRLLAALYSQKEDYRNATPVLEALLLRFPKKQYWVQLSLIYGVLEDYDTSLAVQQVAYTQGYLTEDGELRRLARSYLFNELPYPAAKVLAKGLEDGAIEPDVEAYELLANSWIAAREYDRSLAPLTKAAELAEGGKLYARLGQVHMQREQWREASEMLEKALEKGGLDNPGNVELLLGIAYYNGENLSGARRSFLRAREHEETREQADRWISHLANESAADEAEVSPSLRGTTESARGDATPRPSGGA